MRHARTSVVTASIDALHFIAPIRLGQIVHVTANVNYTGKTSMAVGVRVDTEDQKTGKMSRNCTSYVTFVARDENKKPTPVQPIIPETDEEKRRFEQAKIRKESRLALAKELKEAAKEFQ